MFFCFFYIQKFQLLYPIAPRRPTGWISAMGISVRVQVMWSLASLWWSWSQWWQPLLQDLSFKVVSNQCLQLVGMISTNWICAIIWTSAPLWSKCSESIYCRVVFNFCKHDMVVLSIDDVKIIFIWSFGQFFSLIFQMLKMKLRKRILAINIWE